MEKNNGPKQIRNPNNFLLDYTTGLVSLANILRSEGVEKVRSMLKSGFHLKSFADYLDLEENKNILTEEQLNNPVFVEKAKKLDDIVSRVNSLGEHITEEQLEVSVGKVIALTRY